MAVVPPVAVSASAGGIVYLLEWQETAKGEWSADAAWMEWDGHRWAGRRTVLPESDLTRIEGQNYKAIPRITNYALLRREQERRKRP